MRYRWCVICLVVLGICVSSLAFAEECSRVGWTKRLNGVRLRERPSTYAPVLAVLPYNTFVTIINRNSQNLDVENIQGHWAYVRTPAGRGWVFDAFLHHENLGISSIDPFFERVKIVMNGLREQKQLTSFLNPDGVTVELHSRQDAPADTDELIHSLYSWGLHDCDPRIDKRQRTFSLTVDTLEVCFVFDMIQTEYYITRIVVNDAGSDNIMRVSAHVTRRD